MNTHQTAHSIDSRELAAAGATDRLILFGRVFVAVPLAVFGAEHLISSRSIMQVVPPWMPFHLFWTYFVGIALIAAAISLLVNRQVRLSATLLGVMFFLFVAMIHLPNAVAHPKDRIIWAVAVRDLSFGAGACALAGTYTEQWRVRGTHWLIVVARVCIWIAVIFFGIEHFLHPEFVPGVPLGKLTPVWIPIRAAWGYLTGAALLIAGAGMLMKQRARMVTAGLGLWVVLLVAGIYLPILAAARRPPEITEAVNYVADTLLFGGMILLVAGALPKGDAAVFHTV